MNTDNLKILYVDDEMDNQSDLRDILSSTDICDHKVELDCETDFESAVKRSNQYHLVILDRYKGSATQGGEEIGSRVFEDVKAKFFVPVVFYSGNVADILDKKSQVVGVASKGNSHEELVSEITRLTKHNLPFLKHRIQNFLENEFKKYFWDIIHKENNKFSPDADCDYSLGYMLLRKFADSLSKDNIKNIIGDDSINSEKVHPMEFYIYPMNSTKEFENAEIVEKKDNGNVYVILTPSCDFVLRNGRKRKVEYVLLATIVPLENTSEYKDYIKVRRSNKGIEDIEKKHNNLSQVDIDNKKIKNALNDLKQFINSGKSDRYFFLPGTPFLKNGVIDFQKKEMVDYSSLCNDFNRIAKLDAPFAQSMMASFIRYYNRIGFPDIDADYVIEHLVKSDDVAM